jgi:hypothetical protein
MTSVIPPPIEEPLNTYFAVQLRQHEATIDVVASVMRAAKATKILFRRLEILDKISIGTSEYARMRSDVPSASLILDQLFREGRAVVGLVPGNGYVVRVAGGRTGKVTNLLMHATSKPGYARVFRGTKMKFWARQFSMDDSEATEFRPVPSTEHVQASV